MPLRNGTKVYFWTLFFAARGRDLNGRVYGLYYPPEEVVILDRFLHHTSLPEDVVVDLFGDVFRSEGKAAEKSVTAAVAYHLAWTERRFEFRERLGDGTMVFALLRRSGSRHLEDGEVTVPAHYYRPWTLQEFVETFSRLPKDIEVKAKEVSR